MTLRAVAGVLVLVVLFGASRPGIAATGAEALIARSDSLRALATAGKTADSIASRRVVASDSAKPDTAKIARRDTLRSASDSAKPLPGGEGISDSLAKKPRSLPPRTLTLREQVMFAGGFMAFVALMMASMQNFNP